MMFKCDPAVGSEIAERGIKSILPAGSSPKSQNERERTGVSRLDFSFDLDREGDVDSFGFYDAETHVLSLKGSATFKDPETVPTFLPMFSQTVSAPLQLMLKDKNKGAGWKAESSQQDLKTVEVGLQVRGASRDTGSDDGGRTRIASPECEVNLSLVIPFRVPGDGTAQSGGNTTFSSVSPLPPSPPPYPVLGGKTEKTGEKSKPEKEVVTKGDKEGVPVKPHLHLSNNRKSKKQKETSLKDTKEEEKRTGEDKEEDETDYPDILPSSIKDEDNSVDDEKEVTDHHDVKDVKEIKESDLSEIPPSKKEPVVTDEKGKENKRTSDPLNTKENKNDSREISASPPPEKGGPASSPQTTEQTVNKHSAEGPPAAVTKASTGKSKEAEAETSSQANKKFSGSGDGTSSSVMYLICFSIVLLLIAVVIAYVLGFTKSSKGGGDSLDELGEAPPPLVTAAGKLSFQR
uniref:Uncharacterized protein n=1 Tax=Chromera velia CCMP2878 TaxID=1169474 RepID=A0A0G4HEE5_9ALVE|eukprot:Cvel_6503.t1-p1 / transcript=Cvel_6503.t1 / gene=Cvel_6503 / organism=Chromera_velia_CCMP2878 / gene_product=hypothetical protein / transcript_product=hypothetical protein / location=Cvel_scaffold319:45212-49146(+) / protein_length=460 / sequence_SO=supercontig / SO=protein_coding / is_pseudo=false